MLLILSKGAAPPTLQQLIHPNICCRLEIPWISAEPSVSARVSLTPLQSESVVLSCGAFVLSDWNRKHVWSSQEYIRGLCDPELRKEERYPVDMHCIFAGARGLFLDRLIRDTSAEVLMLEPGCLRLLGQAEPVVMAQSRVQQFVALFQVSIRVCAAPLMGRETRLHDPRVCTRSHPSVFALQEKRSLPSDRESTVKRAFKSFVEERDDKYTMELLLLPSALKEELLGLAHCPTSTNACSMVGDALWHIKDNRGL